MNIKKGNIDVNDKKAVYRLCKSASAQVQTLEPGVSLPVEKWAFYTDATKSRDGSEGEREVLSFTTPDGGKFSTISPTFIRSFMEIVELMEDDPFAIIITGGTSKGGRKFVDCELDCDYNP